MFLNFRTTSSVPKITLAFVVGALGGAAAALLLTPMTGRRMQRKMMAAGEKLYDKMEDLGTAVRKAAQH
jgi:gas vesicle protein